jgi:hypothetical protein
LLADAELLAAPIQENEQQEKASGQEKSNSDPVAMRLPGHSYRVSHRNLVAELDRRLAKFVPIEPSAIQIHAVEMRATWS